MKFSTDDQDQEETSTGRRELLKAIAAGAGALGSRLLLPALWSAPIIASMPLPAHAALSALNCSGEALDPPTSSVLTSGTFIAVTRPTTGNVKLVVTVPPAVLAARVPYQIYEKGTAKRIRIDEGTYRVGVCVVQLAVPSADSTLSGTLEINLPRNMDNTLAYQLRWSGGHTSWIEGGN